MDVPEEIVPVLEDHLAAQHLETKRVALLFTSPEGHPLRGTNFRPLRYQRATDDRNKEIADRLGVLFAAATTKPEPEAEVVPIRPR